MMKYMKNLYSDYTLRNTSYTEVEGCLLDAKNENQSFFFFFFFCCSECFRSRPIYVYLLFNSSRSLIKFHGCQAHVFFVAGLVLHRLTDLSLSD